VFLAAAVSASVAADNPLQRRTGMGKIIISENVSLDGVVQDPTGDEGFKHGGWVGRVGDRGRDEAATVLLDEALGTEAMLLGRRSYEFLAARWPSRTGALADRLNSKPKYVVSSTLQEPAWNNTTVLRGDAVNEVSKLKQQLAGDIVVAASFQLVHTLLEHDLVDELRLMIYPVVLGAGARLFGETSDKKPLRLITARAVAGDLAHLTYEPVRVPFPEDGNG
jgi:dihydrofolate reductase